jgi:hypothetical protein
MLTKFAVAAMTACLALVCSPSTAGADPDVVGMPYGTAKGELWKANLKPVIATVMGDRLAQDQCYVVSASKVTSRDSSGTASNQASVMLNLSCYKASADARTPGFSAGNMGLSAEAVRAQDVAASKAWKQSPGGQKWCVETYTAHPEWEPDPDCELPA